jgi:hypothetical protein
MRSLDRQHQDQPGLVWRKEVVKAVQYGMTPAGYSIPTEDKGKAGSSLAMSRLLSGHRHYWVFS